MPAVDAKVLIGCQQHRSSADVASGSVLTAASVNGQASHVQVGAGRPLFQVRPRPARLDAYPYDVTSDGQRILVNTFVEEVTPPITLIVNWASVPSK
jgi:hypothetical protein